ncbi:MAG: chaperone modulatory protein CbpM [Proteobacteria bacterium]|nr:chaperone modulatory protein CbpM [Pseudomonadota bacterium]
MLEQLHAACWLLDEERAIPLAEFCSATGLIESLVLEMVREGILEPIGAAPPEWRFSGACLARAERALRLQRELELNWAAVAFVLPLLDELKDLRRQRLNWLRTR